MGSSVLHHVICFGDLREDLEIMKTTSEVKLRPLLLADVRKRDRYMYLQKQYRTKTRQFRKQLRIQHAYIQHPRPKRKMPHFSNMLNSWIMQNTDQLEQNSIH